VKILFVPWLLLPFFFLITNGLLAQDELSLGSFFSGESKLVVQALDSSFVIMTQDYVLEQKTGGPKAKRYGKGAEAYFGRQLRVGVVADGKLYIDAGLDTPWQGDADIEPFLDSLVPKRSDMHFRRVRNPMLNLLEPAPVYPANCKTLVTAVGMPAAMQKAVTTSLPMPLVNSSLPLSGRLLVVYHEDDAPVWESALDYAVERLEIGNWPANGLADVTLPEVVGEIAGGAFFEECIQNGRIQYRLAGLLVQRQGQWHLAALNAEASALDGPSLTPIGPKK